MMTHLQYALSKKNLKVTIRGIEAQILRITIELDDGQGIDPQRNEFIRQLQIRRAFLIQKEREIESEPRMHPTFLERVLIRLYDWAVKERFSGEIC